MSIQFLFLVLFAILIFELLILRAELTSPGFIFTASFCLCSACTVYLAEEWHIEVIELETFNMIVISVILFVLIELVVRISAHNMSIEKRRINRSDMKEPIFVSKTILTFTIVLCAICLLWSLVFIFRYISAGDWNAIMAMYKETVNTEASSLGISKKILNQFSKVLTASNYILLFVYNYNNSCFRGKEKWGEKKLYIISFVGYMLFRTLLTGGRQSLLFFVVAWLTMRAICNTYKTDKATKKKENRKYVKIIICAVAIIFPLFYFFGRFVGRKESDILYAATSYLSTGIYGLQWEVSNNYTSYYWGEISFPSLYPILKFFNLMPQNLESQAFLPFFYHGNTVSLLGRWYWDFKESGVYVMVAVISLLISYLYYFHIYYARDGHRRNLSVILYGYLIHIIYFAGYDDFFMNIPSMTFVFTLFLIHLFYSFIVRRGGKIVIYYELRFGRHTL